MRRVVQIAVLMLFISLTVAGLGSGLGLLAGSVFSRLDPLVGLAALVASRAWIAFWAAALLTLAVTVAFGRAWCGWLCPVGTLLDLAPARNARKPRPLPRAWLLGKYVALGVVLGGALFGTLSPMVLDPVTVITRPLQELARPYLGSDTLGQATGALISRSAIHTVALLSVLPLIGVLALNAVGRRTWCRALCPLGGLLAVLSKLPGFRRAVDADACVSCSRCAKVCPTAAISAEEGFASSVAECTACMVCVDECPKGAIAFRREAGQLLAPGYMPERREAVLAFGVGGACLAATILPRPALAAEELLRPPSTDDARLAARCIRCGACYSACPSASLRPSLSLTTVAGPWTPMLDERPRHCSLDCNRCANVCPTDALHVPTEEERILLGLGSVAWVDKPRCRAWGRGKSCMACQAACPIPGAIKGEDRRDYDPNGPNILVPEVDIEQCVGCGVCSEACPLRMPAIVVSRPPAGVFQ